MGDDDFLVVIIGTLNQVLDCLVDLFRHPISVVPLFADLPSQEHHLFPLAEGPRPQLLAHAVPFDHAQSDLSSLFYIVTGSGGDLVEDQLLGNSTAHGHRQHILELVLGPQVAVFFREEGRVAPHAAARNNGNLVHLVRVGQRKGHQGMTGLMVGGHFLFSGANHPALAFRTGDHPLDGLFEFRHTYALQIAAGGQQRCFVDEVGKIGAAEPWRFLGQGLHGYLGVNRLPGAVYLQDCLATHHVGQVQCNPAVEAPRP